MSYCDIEKKSKRGTILRKTLELLLKCNPTPLEINEYTGSTRAASDVSELRQQGYKIICVPICSSQNGIKINRFMLTGDSINKAREFFERYEK